MVLLKCGDYELRTVETAMGFSYPLITGVCIWCKDNFVGIVEPANDVIAKFTCYPTLNQEAPEDCETFNKMVMAATEIVQTILSIV